MDFSVPQSVAAGLPLGSAVDVVDRGRGASRSAPGSSPSTRGSTRRPGTRWSAPGSPGRKRAAVARRLGAGAGAARCAGRRGRGAGERAPQGPGRRPRFVITADDGGAAPRPRARGGERPGAGRHRPDPRGAQARASRSRPRAPSSCARRCGCSQLRSTASAGLELSGRTRVRSFTDIFIKHPVLAVVVNLVIVLVGWRALSALPVQQYPKIESSSVVITTVYTAPAPRPCAASSPRRSSARSRRSAAWTTSSPPAGPASARSPCTSSSNHNSTAALAEVTARLQQVRSELPAEAEPPVVEVQRADRPYASFYLSFTSTERDVPAMTDWLLRTLQPQLSTLPGVQRVTIEGGRPARDAGLDRSRRGWRRWTSRRATCTRRSSATTTSRPSGRPRATWSR